MAAACVEELITPYDKVNVCDALFPSEVARTSAYDVEYSKNGKVTITVDPLLETTVHGFDSYPTAKTDISAIDVGREVPNTLIFDPANPEDAESPVT